MILMMYLWCALATLLGAGRISAEDLRLVDLSPEEAQQHIENKDDTLKYAPKIESNSPAVRVLGKTPTNVLEDIYLANQYHGQDGLGGYLYGYSVPDIAKTEKKKAHGDLRGAYQYINDEGQEIKVQYWDDGTGFHQVDNLPEVLPKQVEDSPEVQAAKDEFFKRWHEEAARNSQPNSVQDGAPNDAWQLNQQQYQPGYPAASENGRTISEYPRDQAGLIEGNSLPVQQFNSGHVGNSQSGVQSVHLPQVNQGSYQSEQSIQGQHLSRETSQDGYKPEENDLRSEAYQIGKDQSSTSEYQPWQSQSTSGGYQSGQGQSSSDEYQPWQGQSSSSGYQPGQGQSSSGGYQPGQSHSSSNGHQPGWAQSSSGGYQPGQGQSSLDGYQLGQGQPSSGGYQLGQDQPISGGYRPGHDQSSLDGYQPGQGQSSSHGYQPGQGHSSSHGYQPGQGQSSLDGYEPEQGQRSPHGYQPGQGQSSLNGYQPGQSQSSSHEYQPGQGQSSLDGYEPEQGHSSPHGYQPGQGQSISHRYEPGQSQSSSHGYQPGQGQSSLDGYEPEQGQSSSHGYQPGQGQSSLNGYQQGQPSSGGYQSEPGYSAGIFEGRPIDNQYSGTSGRITGQSQPTDSGHSSHQIQTGQSCCGGGVGGHDYLGQSSSSRESYTATQPGNVWEYQEREDEKGPPKGFFYNFDYPVGIIVQKEGAAGGVQKRESLESIYAQNKANFDHQVKIGRNPDGSSLESYQVHS